MAEPDWTWIWWNFGLTLTCLHFYRSVSGRCFKKGCLRGAKIRRMGQISGMFYYVFYEIGCWTNCSGIMQAEISFALMKNTWRATVLAALHLLSANYMMWNSTGKLLLALIQLKWLTHQALLSRRTSSCRHCEADRTYFMPQTCLLIHSVAFSTQTYTSEDKIFETLDDGGACSGRYCISLQRTKQIKGGSTRRMMNQKKYSITLLSFQLKGQRSVHQSALG